MTGCGNAGAGGGTGAAGGCTGAGAAGCCGAMKSGRAGIVGSGGGAGKAGAGGTGSTGGAGADMGCAAAGSGSSIFGTRSFTEQLGQVPFLPDAVSGTRIRAAHSGQLNSMAIFVETLNSRINWSDDRAQCCVVRDNAIDRRFIEVQETPDRQQAVAFQTKPNLPNSVRLQGKTRVETHFQALLDSGSEAEVREPLRSVPALKLVSSSVAD